METTIPLQKLDAHGAGRVRDVATALAAAARKGGAEGEEQFWIGIAGVMDSIVVEHCSATGAATPEPLKLGDSGGIKLDGITAEQALAGAQLSLAWAEHLHERKQSRLADFFGEIADVLKRRAQLLTKLTVVSETVN